MSPRVTVIVPAYNGSALLPEALGSITAQTYRDWEAVVVDDASTDNTAAVARAFADEDPERFTVLSLKRNQGVGGARTEGVRRSRDTELLCLLDQDDIWNERYLELSVQAYDDATAEGRRVGIVSSNALMLTDDGITGETWWDRNGWVEPVTLDAMLRRNYLNARSLFSRRAYDDAGGEFARGLGGSDDYDLWLRILERGYEAIGLAEPLVVYRDHAGSFSRRKLDMVEGKLAMYERALDRGALSRRARRVVRGQKLHWRALRRTALLRRAVSERRPLAMLGNALLALPYNAVALALDPRRGLDKARRTLGRG